MRARYLIALLLLAACRGGGTDPLNGDTLAGTYALTTVNGHPVPIVVRQTADEKVTIEDGALVVEAVGALTETDTKRWVIAGDTIVSGLFARATYTITGETTIAFTRTDRTQERGTGLVAGRTVTLTRGDSTFAYVRD